MRIGSLIPVLALTAALMPAPAWAAGRDPLAGKWTATLTPDDDGTRDGAKEYTDTLTIKGSRITSDTLKKDGFESAEVNDHASIVGNVAKFDATMTNKDGDSAKFTGQTVGGGELEGTLVVTKKDGTKRTYTYKATKA